MSLDLCSQRLKSDKTYFDVFFWRTNEHQKNKNKKHTSTPNKGKATRLKTQAASHANCNDLDKAWNIVARFRPHYKTQPKKTRPKAKWALGQMGLRPRFYVLWPRFKNAASEPFFRSVSSYKQHFSYSSLAHTNLQKIALKAFSFQTLKAPNQLNQAKQTRA